MVRRRRRFRVEALETRALLSGLNYSLTTDQSTYQVGQTIEITFTETNTSIQPVTVSVAPTDFTISQGTYPIWQSNPGNATQPASTETLQPGQSLTQRANWDGTTSYSIPAIPGGTPVSWSINNWGTFVVSNPNAPDLTATFQITDPLSSRVTTDQSVYQIGQTIQMTFTETNTSDQAVTFFDDGPAGFSISHNGTTAMQYPLDQNVPTFPITWTAGQTETDTQTWNGIPQDGLYNPSNLSGTFVAAYGPQSGAPGASTSFQIAPPPAWDVVSSVTTNHSTYNVGQTVIMTFNETNNGDQPITIVTGPNAFEASQDGLVIWSSPGFGGNAAWGTLQPGQSLTQTGSWDGAPDNAITNLGDTYVVSNWLDPNGSTATIQINGPPVVTAPPPTEPILPPIQAPATPTSTPPTTTNSGTTNGPTSPLIATTLSTNRRVYRMGQSVQILLTMQEAGTKQKVKGHGTTAVSSATKFDRITVMEGSTLVWQSRRGVFTPKVRKVEPRQTIKLSAVWNGRSNQPGVRKLTPGTYTIETNGADGDALSTTITIEPGRSTAHG